MADIATSLCGVWAVLTPSSGWQRYSQGISSNEEVCVVKQRHLWPLHKQQESELDEQH